ncbi:uncharacterized serine-rich protein C215.13-like [Pecten maximus]|uniref:uncharacterized serine-rich protein C215.13-like n=1 Tax=Pecten maximus TaxID=6579 RepID=UPI00145903C3|nr:uncharacterized serine-rich protein C215.13-like [Pecten maximus]
MDMASNKSVKLQINTPSGSISAYMEPEMAEYYRSNSEALGSLVKEHLQMSTTFDGAANSISSPSSRSTNVISPSSSSVIRPSPSSSSVIRPSQSSSSAVRPSPSSSSAGRASPSPSPSSVIRPSQSSSSAVRPSPSSSSADRASSSPSSVVRPSPSPSTSTSSTDTEGSGCGAWNRSATLLLLEDYRIISKKVEAGQKTKKSMWNEISANLKKRGYSYTPDQVSGRFKTLVRGYKNFKDHQKKSGNGTKAFEYKEEMEELLGQDPAVVPVITLSSTAQNATDIDDSLDSSRDGDETEDTTSAASNATVSESSKRKKPNTNDPVDANKKRRCSSRADVIQSLNDLMKNQESENEKKEARHREKLDVLKELVGALSKK